MASADSPEFMAVLDLLVALSGDDLDDPEEVHIVADGILLKMSGDQRVTKAFSNISKWYA